MEPGGTGHRSTRPPLDGLLEVAIYVEDIRRSAAFYQRVLGLAVIAEYDRLWALAAGPRQILLVCKRGASLNVPLGPHDAQGPQHIAFAIPKEAVDAWRETLEAQQVAIETVHDWPLGGRSVYFRDPDGHLVELASPGVWSTY
jgi:catechol 2,3-dioxygenase-like lactoylglutathione lyase family enzyme